MSPADRKLHASSGGAPHAGPRPKVLSIVGAGRSGSTLLSGILGDVPGVTDAGELRWLWPRDLPRQRVCGCGETPAVCPVWSRVTELITGLAPESQSVETLPDAVEHLASAQYKIGRLRHRRWLLAGFPGADPATTSRSRDSEFSKLHRGTVDAINALAEVTSATLIVDASKRPQEAAIMAASGLDHYVVHMVRDPRAVVYSWRRAKPLPASTGKATMGTRSMRRTLWRWVENATGAEMLRRRVPAERWLFMRYEDLAAAPRSTVAEILRFVGVDAQARFQDENTVQLGVHHVLSGNPNRFITGPVRIVPDEEWRGRLSTRDMAVVGAVTGPFLLRYGYPALVRR